MANLIRDDPSLERARLRSFGCFYQQNALVDGKFQSNCGWCAMVFSIDSLVVVGMFRWDVKRTDVSWMSNVFVVRPMVWNIHIFDILGVAFRRLVEGLASATQTKIISRSFLRQAVECYCLSPAWGRWHCLIASNIEIAMQLSSFIANFAVQLRFRLIDCGWPVGTVIGMTFSAVAKLNTSEYAQKCRIRGYGNYLNFNQYHSATWAPLPKWQQFFVLFFFFFVY